ncbi:RNA polymerase sigma-70 factor [Dyella sp. 2RAB6]|uniref:RNA polymerase sigma-70 factor n=1 Tax=Dyella sp. 2RAB6 TaxID=3232992 RepID=UPI003F935B51
MATNDLNTVFQGLRPRLQSIAYGMLGSVADAEDVVQDVWLRWHAAEQSRIENLEAWLVTATTRTAIDRLRALKARREHYVGMWLPEPWLTEGPDTPEQIQERSSEVSIALLVLLERLSPEARAAVLLREVFELGYPEIALIIDKSEAGVRQIVHRAKAQLQDGRPRYTVSTEAHLRIVRRFAQAMANGEFKLLTALLADDAQLIGDGGGRTTAMPRPMPGGKRIAQLLYAGKLRFKSELGIELAQINGKLAILRFIGGKLESVMALETDGERITDVSVQRNPEKLGGVAAGLGVELLTPL